MRRGLLVALLLLGLGAGSYAVESGVQTMTIVRAEEKAHDQVVAWVNDTPIYQEDPYFALTVRTGDRLLEAEYEPRNAWETLPVFWKPGTKVQGRIEKQSLFLKRPNGTEIRFVIVKRTTVPAEQSQ
jgi:hypothetical protein